MIQHNKDIIGFIGLGAMGFSMAGHLQQKSHHPVMVYNRSHSKSEAWQKKHGGLIASDLKELGSTCSIIMLCVGNDTDVQQNVEGLLPHLGAGSILIDHTTSSVDLARHLFKTCSQHQVSFLDCPISGGQSGAEQGILTMMCGGEQEKLEYVRPLLACYAQKISYFGSSGQGQICKMANQILLCGIIQSLSEAIIFLEKEGMPIADVLDTLKHGAGGSWQLNHRGVSMHERRFDFGFSIHHMLKDLGLVSKQAQLNGSQLPVLNMVKQFYEELQRKEMGHLDTSALVQRLSSEE
jgi:3-hydroxyisobutyrate dehydrogenase